MNYEIKSRPKIPRNKYGYLTTTSTGGTTSRTTTNSGGGGSDSGSNYVHPTGMLWGNPYTGVETLTGDIVSMGKVIGKSGEFISADINNLIVSDASVNGTLNTNVIANADPNATITFNNDVKFRKDVSINGILNTNQIINDNNISTKNLSVTDSITTTNLTVSGSAHFFELIIDKIQAAGGQVVLSPADFMVDLLWTTEQSSYIEYPAEILTAMGFAGIVNELHIRTAYCKRVLQKCTPDDNNKSILVKFQTGDLARCQTFNAVNGTSNNADNKLYWKLVINAGKLDKHSGVGLTDDYLFIDMVDYIATTSGTNRNIGVGRLSLMLEVGDNIVLLGNMIDRDRQSAIIMSAYANPDTENLNINLEALGTPCIAQYKGIHNFTLKNTLKTCISPNGNKLCGDLVVESSGLVNNNELSIIELINQITNSQQTYMHFAYAMDSTGTGFTKTPADGVNYTYLGICTTFVESDATLSYNDYEWSPILFTDIDTSYYRLHRNASTNAKLFVDSGNVTGLLSYNVYKIVNGRATLLSVDSTTKTITDGNNTLTVKYYTNINTTKTEFNNVFLNVFFQPISIENYLDHAPNVSIGGAEQDRINRYTVELLCTNTVDGRELTSVIGDDVVNVILLQGAILEVTNNIKMQVSDASSNIANLAIKADEITSTVEDISTNFSSKITQNSTNIALILDNLEKTGINITDGTITLEALNTIITGNLNLYGLVRRQALHLTHHNISQYISWDSIVGDFGHNSFNEKFWRECGGYIILDNGCLNDYADNNDTVFVTVPSLYPKQTQGIIGDVGRELLGCSIIIYNNSGKTLAITGYMYIYETNRFVVMLNPDDLNNKATTTQWAETFNRGSSNSQPIPTGYFVKLTCDTFSVDGEETIGWLRDMGKINQNVPLP